jgi:hypothetical protein
VPVHALHDILCNNLSETERKRVRKDSRRVDVKRKHLWKARGSLYVGGMVGRRSILLKGTQVMSARPADKDRMRVKTFGW